jgi:hypothetical protein
MSVKRAGKKNKDKVATRMSDIRPKDMYKFPKGGSPSGDQRPVDWADKKKKLVNPKKPKAQ